MLKKAIESVMITLRRWFDVIPGADFRGISASYMEAMDRKQSRIVELECYSRNLEAKLKSASESNAELQIKLKQVTFLEDRVRELEIETKKQTPAPRKAANEQEPIITGRAGWRAISQMRTIKTIPGPQDDSVKQLEHKVEKEMNL